MKKNSHFDPFLGKDSAEVSAEASVSAESHFRSIRSFTINNYFDTPLSIAIRRKLSEKFLKLLILHGADTSYKFPYGLSLLHDAIKRRCFVAIKILVSNGLSLNIRDFKGQNALEYALKKDISISKILIYKE